MCTAYDEIGPAALIRVTWVGLGEFDYTIDWFQLIILAAVIAGYFIFLFRASDKEYREVIAEKFNEKKK